MSKAKVSLYLFIPNTSIFELNFKAQDEGKDMYREIKEHIKIIKDIRCYVRYHW